MSAKKSKLSDFLEKLGAKYRLVVLNDDTFEERLSLRLSRFNVYTILSTTFILIALLMYVLFAFTPMKEFIPGYGDVGIKEDLENLSEQADSLQQLVSEQKQWIANLEAIMNGTIGVNERDTAQVDSAAFVDTGSLDRIPIEDVLLREEMENEENYALIFSSNQDEDNANLAKVKFFPPVKGYVTAPYDPNNEHYGVDVVTSENEPVKATLDGTVILASWTMQTGYVIAIQHDYNLVSFYKHNSALMKKVGTFVKAGEVVAIVGNTGELTTGPHLHFELWRNGMSVDPEVYMVFK